MSNNQEGIMVFASKVNGIEFDVTDPVTAKLLRGNAKSEFIQEVGDNGVIVSGQNNRQASGGEIELG